MITFFALQCCYPLIDLLLEGGSVLMSPLTQCIDYIAVDDHDFSILTVRFVAARKISSAEFSCKLQAVLYLTLSLQVRHNVKPLYFGQCLNSDSTCLKILTSLTKRHQLMCLVYELPVSTQTMYSPPIVTVPLQRYIVYVALSKVDSPNVATLHYS